MSALLRSAAASPAATTIAAYLIVSQRLQQLGVTILLEQHRNGRDYYWDSSDRTLWLRPDAHPTRKLWVAEDLYKLMTGPADHISPSIPDPALRVIKGGAN